MIALRVAALALILLAAPAAHAACGDGTLDPGEECDDCPIFPDPDQSHPEVCTPARR